MKPVALITGASSGIGAALAKTCAENGFDLILVARRKENLREVARACAKHAQVEIVVADVTANDFVPLLRSSVEQRSGISLVIANAGIGGAGQFNLLKSATHQRVWETNVNGVIKTIEATQHALAQAKGTLAIMGSLNSFLALPLGSPYNMSKFAVRALAETLRGEEPILGFKTLLICPGPVQTEIVLRNNSGELIDRSKISIPTHGISPERAAVKIFKGIQKGKREIFLDHTSWLATYLHRLFPALTIPLITLIFKLNKKKFLRWVAEINPSEAVSTD